MESSDSIRVSCLLEIVDDGFSAGAWASPSLCYRWLDSGEIL